MVLTFWSGFEYVTLWYASPRVLSFFGYTTLRFVGRLFNETTKTKRWRIFCWLGRKENWFESSTVHYARLFHKKLQWCSWLQIKGVMNHTFVADFLFHLFLRWCSIFQKKKKKTCFGLIYVHLICLSQLIFPTLLHCKKMCVHNVSFFSLIFFFDCSLWKKCKKFQTCKCLIWTTNSSFLHVFIFSWRQHKIKNVVSQNLFTKWKIKKIWVTFNV